MALAPCHGCGALVPDDAGPTHEYLGASPGCWAVYGRLLAREYSQWYDAGTHRLAVDAYSVQHPGVPERRTIQSVAVHLLGLWTVFEGGTESVRATGMLRHAILKADRFTWLEPPSSMGTMTVLDVVDAPDRDRHVELVSAWARSAWQAWSAHHETLRRWAKGAE